MRKIINRPDQFVDESVQGILAAHPEYVAVGGDIRVLRRADSAKPGRVSIITGGGSGHLPLFLGYIGEGLLTGAAIGNVFSSPSSDQIYELTKAVDNGAGVLYLYGNYGGDIMNFDDAAESAGFDDIETATVVGADDVLSAPVERAETRRGVAGLALMIKCAGAVAEAGGTLAEVASAARHAGANTRTAGVGLGPTILPATGKPSFELPDGVMEVGVGIHGEPGVARVPIETANQIAERVFRPLAEELALTDGDRVAVLINGLGATPAEELYILYREVAELLDGIGATPAVRFIGNYAASMEMVGASVTLMRLDDELERQLDAPSYSPLVRFGR